MSSFVFANQGQQSFSVDLPKLIETRLLAVASSGGGKSHLIRKLLEVTHGHVQQILFDIEGDFSSLRAPGSNYILAGRGGDIPVDPRTAEVLARKVLELGTSIILDLYELKHHDRLRFVRLFLSSMIDSPKELWHPCLVVIDEAHLFCPEKGQAESSDAVIDLASRGRKRGFCAVLATQRLAKLNKDAAAECLNKLVGGVGLDIDVKRAAEELGFSTHEATSRLRNLEPGEFFAYGRALSKTVTQIRVGPTKTAHPKAGQYGKVRVAPPTAQVKAQLAKLADLPAVAQAELTDRNMLRARVMEQDKLIAELRKAQPMAPKVDVESERKAMKKVMEAAERAVDSLWMTKAKAFKKTVVDGLAELDRPVTNPADWKEAVKEAVRKIPMVELKPHKPVVDWKLEPSRAVQPDEPLIGKPERAILSVLVQAPGSVFSKAQVAARSGYSLKSSGFANSISKLVTAGMVERMGPGLRLKTTPGAISHLVTEQPKTLQDWVNKLGKCEGAILKCLMNSETGAVSKEAVAALTEYSTGSSGFANAISHLCTLGLIVRSGVGLAVNPELR